MRASRSIPQTGKLIMLRESLRSSLAHVGQALREPEEFSLRWHREGAPYRWSVWLALAATAICGTLTYGMTLGINGGASAILLKSILLTACAGLAWAIPLPALYILNSLAGSRLRPSTTFLAALITTSWGGLALVASIPINWLFSVAVPDLSPELISASLAGWIVLGVNLVVFTGVGVSMADVFGRVVEALEPEKGRQPMWFLLLVGVIGAQLMFVCDLFA
jgi:hypothetical protein